MSEPYRVSLRVNVDGHGYPTHHFECQDCHGDGGLRGAMPDGSYEYRCDSCHGLGSIVDESCGCSICEQILEDLAAHGHA